MPPRKPRGGMRGRGRGRGRGASSGRGRRKRLPSSTSITTPENSDDECTSTNGNVSISPQFTGKKQAEYNEERELSLPRLKCTAAPENSTFLSLLSCENHDYVMTDDELDHVQWDLELMLTSIILRRNIVRDELSTFAAMQFTHSLNRTTKNPILPTIRPRAAAEISPVNECRKMKVDFDPTSKELPPNKTESANRFWSLVEPYLAHAKEEDLNWLEDLIKSYSPNKKLYEIPPLGEHYAMNWAKEELEIQKNQSSSCSPRLSKKLKIAERISPNVVELVTKVNSAIHDDNVYTPIYQRVVSALVEHTHSSIEDLDEHFPEFDDEDNQQEMSNTCKEFYAEQDIKKQLCKLGLMSDSSKSEKPPAAETLPSIDKSDEDHDEILEEIMKCDNSLTQLREINKNHLIELLNRCRNDYYQQIIKEKMENVNKEIINYKINQNEALAKEKKVVQTSEEEDDLNYLLDQRSNYLLQLQSLLFESNSYLSSSVSDNSESSDEESDPSKVHIKTELSEASEHDTSVNDMNQNDKMDYEYQNEENIENDVKINIKQERMDCDQENDANGEYNEQVIDINIDEKISIEEQNVSNEINETVNIIEDKNEQDVFIQQDNINEEGTSNTVISTDKYHRKLKKSIFKNEHTFEIESRRPIKVIQESIKYESEVDPSETIMDDVKRDLRPQKLNDTIYFEPYDGTSSDESDFTDILE